MSAPSRPVFLLLNLGHALDHLFMLIFATAVTSIPADFGFARWEDLMPYGVGAFFLFEGASSALGTWAAARLFDVFGSYQIGFAINILTVLLAIAATLVFRRSIARDRAGA